MRSALLLGVFAATGLAIPTTTPNTQCIRTSRTINKRSCTTQCNLNSSGGTALSSSVQSTQGYCLEQCFNAPTCVYAVYERSSGSCKLFKSAAVATSSQAGTDTITCTTSA
jgi:hypothetical protein